MNTPLSKFLEVPDVSELRGKYYLKRFDTEITYTAMTDAQQSEYRESCSKLIPKRNKQKTRISSEEKLDFSEYKRKVLAHHIIDPNFSDPEFLRNAGCALAEEFFLKKLTLGEITDIFLAINDLSGLDNDIEDDISEAKN